ncbi:MAG TPA: hypothetical protein VN408_28885 [Actinoplanes sp.]|nr:hypothetical protein [Actinoplanes sp.]
MAVIDVENASEGWLVLWTEPLGEDRWMRPGERFRVRSAYQGDEVPFTVTYWSDAKDRAAGIENVTVVDERGDTRLTVVTDITGTVIECGHRRVEPEPEA